MTQARTDLDTRSLRDNGVSLCENNEREVAFVDPGDVTSIAPVENSGTATTCGTVLNIITGALGSGIFTLPWSTQGATLLPAAACILLVLCVNAWTIGILIEAAEKYQVFDLGAVLCKIGGRPGKGLETFCNVSIWVSTYGVLISYFIVMSSSAMRAIGEHMVPRPILLLVASLLVLPLCFLDQGKLAFSSGLTVAVNVYIFILLCQQVISNELSHSLPEPCFLFLGRGVVAMLTALVNSLIIQMCVLPMYGELPNRSPKKFRFIIFAAFSGLFIIFTCFSWAGSVMYGLNVKSNILLNLPTHAWGTLAQWGTVVAVAGVYPIFLLPMVAPLQSTRFARYKNITTIAIVASTVGIAFFVDDLGILNVINGAFCLGVFVTLFPAVAAVALLGYNRILIGFFVLLGSTLTVLGFIFTDNFQEDNIGHCLLGD